MNTVWSKYIQGTGTLYYSRMLRFSDIFRERYTSVFGIRDGDDILEVGCGPGALCQALRRWYPRSDVTGIDLDDAFIKFASEQSPDIKYLTGDVTALPFRDHSFGVTISNTVSEHVEPSKFFGEQYRVLRPGGVCIVLSARRGISVQAPCIAECSEEETRLWEKCGAVHDGRRRRYSVGAYHTDEAELPRIMEQYGFRDVSTEYITVSLTPDSPQYPRGMALAMIEAGRRNDLDAIEAFSSGEDGALTADEAERLVRMTNEKFDRRAALYNAGVRQWDTEVALTMVVRGVK